MLTRKKGMVSISINIFVKTEPVLHWIHGVHQLSLFSSVEVCDTPAELFQYIKYSPFSIYKHTAQQPCNIMPFSIWNEWILLTRNGSIYWPVWHEKEAPCGMPNTLPAFFTKYAHGFYCALFCNVDIGITNSYEILVIILFILFCGEFSICPRASDVTLNDIDKPTFPKPPWTGPHKARNVYIIYGIYSAGIA